MSRTLLLSAARGRVPMRFHPDKRQRAIEKEMIRVTRRALGRNLVSLVIEGSRATGDALPDSDYDGVAFVRRPSRTNPSFASLKKRTGLRIGVGVIPVTCLERCVQRRGFEYLCLDLRLGRARVLAGRDIIKALPSVKSLIRGGFRKEMQADYWAAVLPESRSNVFRREPRRHVGFIIAICNALVMVKGVHVRKADLPRAMKEYHPRLAVLGLLRRALWRRAHWPEIGRDRRQVAGALRDLKEFLRRYRRYVFGRRGRSLTAAEFMVQYRETHHRGKLVC